MSDDKKMTPNTEDVLDLTEIVKEGDPGKRLPSEEESASSQNEGMADLDVLFGEDGKGTPAAEDRDLQSLFEELESGGAAEQERPTDTTDQLDDFFLSAEEERAPSFDQDQARNEAAELDAFIHGLSFEHDETEPEQLTENVRESLETILTQDGLPESWISGIANQVSEHLWPQLESRLQAEQTPGGEAEEGAVEDELAALRRRLERLEKQFSEEQVLQEQGKDQADKWRQELASFEKRLSELEQQMVNQDEISELAQNLRHEMREVVAREAPQLAAQAIRAEIQALSGQE